jgi:hypothetical protein
MEIGSAPKYKNDITVPFSHLLSLWRPVKMVSLFGLSDVVTTGEK